ncbi:MAG: hypothetical protein JWR09_3774 [Mucilaginibacter sp.]|nr:hypothetical protein [Mucilaginibacter sp.]
MKKVLIISPYYPPANAADMHRVRTSLSYFKENGWLPAVVAVDEKYTDMGGMDSLLLESVPAGIPVYKVQAFDKRFTSRFGLGSIALRSLWYYRKKVDKLLAKEHFDLIYFSTTQFPICVLGSHWKKKFKVPYVIDMQDPWHSDYYEDKPKHQRPVKYWFSYRLNKYLEPIAMTEVGGLISVSKNYIDALKNRYPKIREVPADTITFGAFGPDLDIAKANQDNFENLLMPGFINVVYIGRGGADMHKAIHPLFEAIKAGLGEHEFFSNIRLYFIGTSYAPAGQGKQTVVPIAKEYGIEKQVIEITDRISYYHSLATLLSANGIFLPGSDDPHYTASKIYPIMLLHKPVLAIFNKKSPAISVLKEYGARFAYNFEDITCEDITAFLKSLTDGSFGDLQYNESALLHYSARWTTRLQCELFDKVSDDKN